MSALFQSKANASYGEIIQGCLSSDEEFLVTLPIDKFSRACFEKGTQHHDLKIMPHYKYKIHQLVAAMESMFKIKITGRGAIVCPVVEGKGLSSSTADLVAFARVLGKAYELNLDPEQIDKLLSQVEPSDGIAHEGIVAYNYKKCKKIKDLSPALPFTILSYDEGGTVDTLSYSKHNRIYTYEQKHSYDLLLKQLKIACVQRDLKTIGRIATKSTLMWQERYPKKSLFKILKIARSIEALGVVNTHSGSCLGILLDSNSPNLLNQIAQVQDLLRPIELFQTIPDIFKDNRRHAS